MRVNACSDGGESGALSATLCSWPTTSSCGTNALLRTVIASQNNRMGGIHSVRVSRAKRWVSERSAAFWSGASVETLCTR